MKQLRSTRSTGSSLIDQYINDCRAVGDSLQVNVQRLTDDIRTMLSACSRSTGKNIEYYFKEKFVWDYVS
jgi:hypothetical protein